MALNWAQNDGVIQSGPGPNEPGPRPESISFVVRTTESNPVAGPGATVDEGTFGLIDPNSWAPRATPGNDGPDPGGYDPMVFGLPAHPYRFEVWRLTANSARGRVIDINMMPETVLYDHTVSWELTAPGEMDDELFVQLHVHHTMNQTDNVWIRPIPDFSLVGDVDQDGDVDIDDLTAFCDEFALQEPADTADVNGDGDVDLEDLDALLTELGTLRGDLNPTNGLFNGHVDVVDFGILAGSFGKPGIHTYLTGDLNKDGNVDILDFGILAGNFGGGNGPAAVLTPEPATMCWLGAVGAFAFTRRRRHLS